MIEMKLIRIVMNEKRGEQVVVLREKDGRKTIPIVIGIPEASAIKIKIADIRPPRPLTHDLLKNTIEQLGARLEKVVIDKIKKNTFYAKLFLKTDHKLTTVDARPSDSIALALRAKAPIFVSREVLNQAGMEPDSNLKGF